MAAAGEVRTEGGALVRAARTLVNAATIAVDSLMVAAVGVVGPVDVESWEELLLPPPYALEISCTTILSESSELMPPEVARVVTTLATPVRAVPPVLALMLPAAARRELMSRGAGEGVGGEEAAGGAVAVRIEGSEGAGMYDLLGWEVVLPLAFPEEGAVAWGSREGTGFLVVEAVPVAPFPGDCVGIATGEDVGEAPGEVEGTPSELCIWRVEGEAKLDALRALLALPVDTPVP